VKVAGQLVAFIANLNWDVTEDTLRTALVGCEVKEVRMGMDKETQQFRGYAHVEVGGLAHISQNVVSGSQLQ
jgi:nucleolin